MVTIVTRNASGRIRGFLASCACEVGPGIYVAPRMNAGVRDRVWAVVRDWCQPARDMAALMAYSDPSSLSGVTVRTVGLPRTEVAAVDGHLLTRRPLPERSSEDETPF